MLRERSGGLLYVGTPAELQALDPVHDEVVDAVEYLDRNVRHGGSIEHDCHPVLPGESDGLVGDGGTRLQLGEEDIRCNDSGLVGGTKTAQLGVRTRADDDRVLGAGVD